jgi:hypothetical protein
VRRPGALGRARAAAAIAASLALGCPRAAPREAALEERVDAALRRGVAFLVAAQDPDGAWRSSTYGALKDGWSLTAAAAKALAFAPRDPAAERALGLALERLASAATADGAIDAGPGGLPYPVYTASLAVIALTCGRPDEPQRHAKARDAWLALLESHQLAGGLGWTPADAAYGGWGYSVVPLRRSASDGAFEADLSSTLFALGALRIAGRPADHERVRAALAFVERCQNLPCGAEAPGASRDDGGFFMTPCNEFQNKAGGTVRLAGSARLRSSSYGSQTADGVRALLRCGLAPDHPRVRAARAWLEERFDPAHNPGDFERGREVERDAAWYYGAWSMAHASVELGIRDVGRAGDRRPWAEALAEELLARAGADGAWRNPRTMVKEDDPLVATPLALAALSLARPSLGAPAR